MVEFIIAIIFTEALTELAVKSELFEPVRKKLFKSKYKVLNFIHRIFDCGYCFSVWAAMITLIFFMLDNYIINWFILGIVLHRLSNLFHFLMDKLRGVRD